MFAHVSDPIRESDFEGRPQIVQLYAVVSVTHFLRVYAQ